MGSSIMDIFWPPPHRYAFSSVVTKYFTPSTYGRGIIYGLLLYLEQKHCSNIDKLKDSLKRQNFKHR